MLNSEQLFKMFKDTTSQEFNGDLMMDSVSNDEGPQNAYKKWVEIFKRKYDGKVPIFEDFWANVVRITKSKDSWNKAKLELAGKTWEKAGLGDSNWKSIWEDNYEDPDTVAFEVFELADFGETSRTSQTTVSEQNTTQFTKSKDTPKAEEKQESVNENNQIGQTELVLIKIEKLIEKKPTPNILIENLLLFSIIIIHYKWVSNLGSHVTNFFNLYSHNFSYYFSIICLGLLAIYSLTIGFSAVSILTSLGWKNGFKKISFRNLKIFLITSPIIFLSSIIKKVENEYNNKLFIPFWVIALISLFIIYGSPIINNYKGVIISFEVPKVSSRGNPDPADEIVKFQDYVYNKNDKNSIEKRMDQLYDMIMNNDLDEYEIYEYEDYDFSIYTRGYIFEETAIIEGFKPIKYGHKGFYDYISDLAYFSLEKLILAIIWVLIPFLAWTGLSKILITKKN